MNPVETQLLEALQELQRAVNTRSGREKSDLMAIFSRLDRLTKELPGGTDANLLHYLHRKSYEKARLWLEGREAENRRGPCAAP
jgi:hypothetical protein